MLPIRLLTNRMPLAMLLLTAWAHLSFDWHLRPGHQASLDHIVLDAGHGGLDPGCSGRVAKEKAVALAVALKVQKLFKDNNTGIKVSLTREGDSFVGLDERAQIANKRKADLFISIHCNANNNHAVYGSEAYAVGLHKEQGQLQVMMTENSSLLLEENHEEKYDGFDPKSPEAYIIFSLMQSAYLKQSLQLAGAIQQQMRDHAKRTNRGVKQAGFWVLWKTSMPAVLCEIGFLTNPVEEKFLASEQGQQHIANAIYKAVLQYKAAP